MVKKLLKLSINLMQFLLVGKKDLYWWHVYTEIYIILNSNECIMVNAIEVGGSHIFYTYWNYIKVSYFNFSLACSFTFFKLNKLKIILFSDA